MEYNIHYDIMSGIVCAIMIIANISMPFKNHSLRRLYTGMLVVVFLSCVFDGISGYMLSNPSDGLGYSAILYVDTFLFFVFHSIAPFLLCLYMSYSFFEEKLPVKYYIYMAIPVIVFELLMIVNPVFEWVYTIKDGVYQRGPLIYANYISAFIYLFAILAGIIVFWKKITMELKLVVVVYISVAMATVFIQYFCPELLVECAGMTATLLIIFYALQSKDMIEEGKKKESELTRIANEANRAKSEFLTRMSHEIRTPINTMLGMNQMILRETDSYNIKKYSDSVETAGQTLMALVNDILDFSKLELGKLSINNKGYLIELLIKELLEEIRPAVISKNLELKISVDSMLPKKLYGDPIRIRQCIINLLSNAVKYTDNGYVELVIRYERLNPREIMLNVSVRDTGSGLTEEMVDNLSKAYDINEVGIQINDDESGLGLSITRQVLALMDSKLSIKSRQGVGSDFSFSIRQSIIDNTSVGNVKWLQTKDIVENVYGSFVAPSVKVLVVDDNEMNLLVMRELLKVNKIKVVTVSSGEECLKATRKIAFDLIFMDHMMPNMDGKQTFVNMKKDTENICKNVPVVMLTANAIAGVREQYLNYGFSEYISKPVDYKILEDVMVNLLPQEKLIMRE